MIEKHFIIDDVDPAALYGTNGANLSAVKALCPKVRLSARGSVVKAIGDAEQLAMLEEAFEAMRRHLMEFNTLGEADVVSIIKGKEPQRQRDSRAIVYSVGGRAISPRKGGQEQLVGAFEANDMVIAEGPAGTGKTYIAIALAVRALKQKHVRRIILSRPAVEAGEKLGFLPGDMREKIDPYLQPLYDALEDMVPAPKLKEMMEQGTIQIAPLAFMRGRTLSDAVVILDEAQNTTREQLKMFLTRMGQGTKMIVTGDVSQIDLPPRTESGLPHALGILADIDGIGIVRLHKSDIVRHRLVTRIVEEYSKQTHNDESTNNH